MNVLLNSLSSNIHVTTSQSEKWNIAWILEVTFIFPMTIFPQKRNHYPDYDNHSLYFIIAFQLIHESLNTIDSYEDSFQLYLSGITQHRLFHALHSVCKSHPCCGVYLWFVYFQGVEFASS